MKKIKRIQEALIGALLSLVDTDLNKIRSTRAKKMEADIFRGLYYTAIEVIVPTRHTPPPKVPENPEPDIDRLKKLQGVFRPIIESLVKGDLKIDDLAHIKFNYVLAQIENTWRLVVNADLLDDGQPNLWRTRLALAWALHERPTGCIRRCLLCEKLFLQRTARRKDYCSHAHAMLGADARRKNDPARKEQIRQAVRRHRQKTKEMHP